MSTSDKDARYSSWVANAYGSISFGSLLPDKTRSACFIGSKADVRHYMMMNQDGATKGQTIMQAPGKMEFKTGEDRARGDIAYNVHVEHGDVCITAKNGDLRLQGKNVIIEAKGDNKDDGVMTLKANTRLEGISPKINLTGKKMVLLQSEQCVRIIGNKYLDMVTGIGQCVSDSSRYGSQGATQGKIPT